MSSLLIEATTVGASIPSATLQRSVVMKLCRGASVFAEKERFGELGDVVVDPFTHRVTHLVVDPGGDHLQQRLVPLWLVEPLEDGDLRIALPASHVRQLQRALDSDFVRLPSRLVRDDEIARFKSVLALPYFVDPTNPPPGDDPSAATVAVEHCEIRRSSWVTEQSGQVLGTVAGFLLDDGRVYAVIVRSGVIGHRHNVVVPIKAVSRVASHFVTIDIDRHAFRSLPITNALAISSLDLRPRQLWREVLGLPTNTLWDNFEIDDPPEETDDEADEPLGADPPASGQQP